MIYQLPLPPGPRDLDFVQDNDHDHFSSHFLEEALLNLMVLFFSPELPYLKSLIRVRIKLTLVMI